MTTRLLPGRGRRIAGAPLAKTKNAQYQQDFRDRAKERELKEVRGLYLPPSLHPELKAAAKRMLAKAAKKEVKK